MKHPIRHCSISAFNPGLLLAVLVAASTPARAIDLLQRYPTTLTAGMLEPTQAQPWQFLPGDIYRVSQLSLKVGDQLKIETGAADLGIGHCANGAICAMLIPVEGGKLTRPGASGPEAIAHIWLRFHPGEINKLFPAETISAGASTAVMGPMRSIAAGKFRSSYHAGMNAMIPEPKDMTVDVDTRAGVRRFFMVNTQAKTAEYVNAFERQPVRLAGHGKSAAPKILFTKPVEGATDVDPGLREITVTFDQDMGEGFSWTGSGPEFPPSADGEKPQWRGKRTCVLPVKLEAGHHYRVGINAPSFHNFCSAEGTAVEPSSISFTTK